MSESQQAGLIPASKNRAKLCAGPVVDLQQIWTTLRLEAEKGTADEPFLGHLAEDVILSRSSLASALGARLARRLAREDMPRTSLEPLLTGIFEKNPPIVHSAVRDLQAVLERDPACFSLLEPLLFFKGFLALTTYRVSHQLWIEGRRWLALYFQSVASEAFAVDIHPAAQIGCGILLDHATSFVVGETAIIEDDVSILHPIIRSGVLIGAGAKILGRVEIGTGAKIGAGSVVLNDVSPHRTVAGVPAVVVGISSEANPASEMNQRLDCSGNI
jgi:serine O-acetyltransferase